MNAWAIATFASLVFLAVAQAPFLIHFVSLLRRHRTLLTGHHSQPRVELVLCLRGADPFLPRCVQAILDQDYPCYSVQIIVDSRDDPAWEMAHRLTAHGSAVPVRISELCERRETCSLKCSALLQAVAQLDPATEVIALVDADTVPHRTWLRELTAPLSDPRVGVTTGNRWYAPDRGDHGSLIRYCWNASAVVNMNFYNIPWGGTMALRTDVIRRLPVVEHWGLALCEDVALSRLLGRGDLRMQFVPSLIMVNREECGLADLWTWVRRQLMLVRLYHPWWWGVVGHGTVTTLPFVAAAVLLTVGIISRHWTAVAWVAAGLAAYGLAMLGLLYWFDFEVHQVTRAREMPLAGWNVRRAMRALLMLPVAQFLHFTALAAAGCARTVTWRRVRYRVKGPFDVRLLAYAPYSNDVQPTDSLFSL